MPPKIEPDQSLEKEIALLRDLLKKAADESAKDHPLEEQLALLDSVAQAAPKLASVLKSQRSLTTEEVDPMALLRQALRELEEEWPELHACKELIRNGGLDPAEGTARAAGTAEAAV